MARFMILLVIIAGLVAFSLLHAAPTKLAARQSHVQTVPASWVPKQASRRWQCIVIHHSATDIGSAQRFDRAHRARGWDELAYHFVIGNGSDTADGEVEVGPRWTKQKHGAHTKTPDDYYNEHGIGICLVGNFQKDEPTREQLASLVSLLRYLSRQYNIPTTRIYTHGQVTGRTECPGKHFDLQAVRDALRRWE